MDAHAQGAPAVLPPARAAAQLARGARVAGAVLEAHHRVAVAGAGARLARPRVAYNRQLTLSPDHLSAGSDRTDASGGDKSDAGDLDLGAHTWPMSAGCLIECSCQNSSPDDGGCSSATPHDSWGEHSGGRPRARRVGRVGDGGRGWWTTATKVRFLYSF